MILLTGATGASGSFIANEFVEQRVPVRILVRDKAKAKRLDNVATVDIVEGDMSNPGSLTEALDGDHGRASGTLYRRENVNEKPKFHHHHLG